MAHMNGDYKNLLRTIHGEPTVGGYLWDTVTSIEEGDEAAYGRALRQVGDMTRKYFWGAPGSR